MCDMSNKYIYILVIFCILHNNLSTYKLRTRFHEQHHPHATMCAKVAHVLGLLVHDRVVVVFGRKVFLVDRLFW